MELKKNHPKWGNYRFRQTNIKYVFTCVVCYWSEKGFLNLGIRTNLWEIQSLRNVSQEGGSAEVVSFCLWSDWEDHFRNYFGEDLCDHLSDPTAGGIHYCGTGSTPVSGCKSPFAMPQQSSCWKPTAGDCHCLTGSFESDFDKILPQLLGLMLFPFWWSPELSASERSERISGFEKHYLLTNASISFPTQISTQRKCTISPLWVK